MANNTIDTRIILKNDSTANWTSKDPVLLKGEVGFDLDLGIFKVGDGNKKWSEITVTYSNLQDILKTVDEKIQEAVGDLHQTQIFEADVENGGDKIAAITAVVAGATLYKGDIAIAKEVITGDKKEYTAYVYNGTTWAAMDGNYNASNVIFDKDFTATYQFGKYKPDSTGSVTVPANGKSLLNLIAGSYAEEQNPSTTQPTVTLNSNNIGAKEVGTNIAINYAFSTTTGSYTYGPATGVTFSDYSATFNSETKTGASGSFTSVQVTDNTNLSISGSCTSSDGEVPLTNLGNEYPDGKIVGKTWSPTKGTLTGFRGWFYGYYNGTQTLADASAINSDQIRALNGSNGAKTSFPATLTTNQMQQMFFAAPAGKKASLSISNAVNGAPLTVTKTTVQVEGANNYDAIAYDLFYVANAVAESGESKWNIK